MYACKNGKYWTALRDATRSPDDLGKELLELVKVDLSIERLCRLRQQSGRGIAAVIWKFTYVAAESIWVWRLSRIHNYS